MVHLIKNKKKINFHHFIKLPQQNIYTERKQKVSSVYTYTPHLHIIHSIKIVSFIICAINVWLTKFTQKIILKIIFLSTNQTILFLIKH